MGQQPASRLFISYAHQDGVALARRLHQDLKANGWDVWLDAFRLTGGASWTAEVESALESSDIVLALLSRGSFLSDTCRAEQLRSLRKNKCVIPILVEADADRPIHLESKQYLDFSSRSDYDTQFPALIACIQARTGAALNRDFQHTYITVPPLPPNYVERTAELHALRSAILRDGVSRRVALTALKGMAGIGKTVLAQALCLDEVIQAAFPDAIIWVPVGKGPRDLVSLLREVGKAIGDSLDGYDSVQSASNRLRNRLSGKAVLIVLDDIWDPHDAAPFLFESPRSRLMITTRNARTAIALGAQQQLAVLTWDQSLQLIAMWADLDLAKLPPQAPEIVRECGCLPLAVAMVGAQLRGRPERWDHVLQKLRNADLDRIRQSFPEYPHPDLLRAIDVSMESLPTDLRERYLDFAVFPEDCAIPETAVGTLWNLEEYDVADSVDQLVDLSLATRDGDRRLRIHDLVLDYLRRALGADKLVGKHRDLLASYGSKCAGQWPRGPNDGYFFENLLWHLRSSRQADEGLRLVMDFAWMDAKLDACGIRSLVTDYDWFAPRSQDARLVQEALRLSSYVLAMDRTQLAGQLLGRLPAASSAAIESLHRVATQATRSPWLRPLRSLLTPPGGPLMFTLAGHASRVRSVAQNRDGTRAISASDDHTLKVWDLERGILERTLIGHSDAVRAVILLPDGERAVSASDDHTLRVWDLSTGHEVAFIDTQLDWIRGLVALPRTAHVASISDDRSVRIWDLLQGKVIRALRGHAAEVNCVALMPDGESLVTAGDDRTVRVWAPSGRSCEILKGHTARIVALAVAARGSILSISTDGAVRLWTGAPSWQSQLLNWRPMGVRNVTFSPDGNFLLAGADDGNVHIWDLATQRERMLEGHSDWVNCVAVGPDGRHALSGSDDATLKLWDITRLSAVPPVRDHLERVRAVSITSDGSTAISTSDDHTLCVWELSTRAVQRILPNQQHWVFACIPGSRRLVSSGSSGSISLWDLETGQELQRFIGHQDRVRALAVSPCGRQMISGGDDRTIRVWEVDSAKEVLLITLVRQWPRSIAITSDGRFAVTAAEGSTLKAWNLATAEEALSFRGHTGRINSVAVLDSNRVVSGADDHTVRVWDLRSGHAQHVMTGHDGKVNAVASLPGGTFVVSASDDCEVRVWDADAGTLLATHTAESPILACAGSPRGRQIVAGDRSGLVHFLALEGCADLVTAHG